MLIPGTILRDSYSIVRLVAQGGMGAVYLAKHQRLGSTVAVKETFFSDPGMLKAFEREARLLAGLRHPALPKVIDHFPEGDGWFLVMEFIAGDDLGDMLKDRGGSFPVDLVLDWADQLLSALEYLHKQTPPVIHRDIKPQNLKLTEEGQIVLLDFGLAKGQADGISRVSAGHSIRGYSPAYAPLEQIQGAGTDARSDLYSLAATIYHLITGFTPADALTRAAIVVAGKPDPLRPANALNAQVTQGVANVLMQAMSQSCDRRPECASEMRKILRAAMRNDLGNDMRNDCPTVVAPPAPGGILTLPMASQPRRDPPGITTPTSVAGGLPVHGSLGPDTPSAREEANPQTRVHGTESMPPLQPARKPNRPSWMMFSIGVLLIAGIALFAWLSNRKSTTASSTMESSDPAAKPALKAPDDAATKPASTIADPSAKPASKTAEPAMKSFDFDVVTVDAKGEITDRRKKQARFFSEDLGHGVTLQMVELPGGTFTMGSPANEAGRDNTEGPQHLVAIPRFYFAKFEVTQAQWRAVAGMPKLNRVLTPDPSNFKGDDLPVERVSWEDAMEFCARLTIATGRTNRLPTEAEWEYASRAGTTTAFAFGENVTPALANYDEVSPYGSAPKVFRSNRERTTPAGFMGVANAFGLYDMQGNVWEWCLDYWHENYNGAPTDGTPWDTAGDARYRILRGGSWLDPAGSCRSARRLRSSAPDLHHGAVGFRVVAVARTL